MHDRMFRWVRMRSGCAVTALAVAALLPGCARAAAGSSDRPSGAGTRTFELTYAVQVAAPPAGARELQLWIPLPRTDAFQTITGLQVQSPHPVEERREPVHGNRMLHLALARPDAGPFEVGYTCRVTRREASSGVDTRMTAALRERYLASNTLVPVTGLAMKLSREILPDGSSDREAARALFDYVDDQMSYDKSIEGWGRGDFSYACETGKGNCTDFHAMFIGLARAAHMPARFEIGLQLPPDRGAGETGAYHCWAWCYIGDDGWLPVDISEADKRPDMRDDFFGTLCENRVSLSDGRDITLSPPQRGAPLNYFVNPYAELDGRPFDGVTKRSTYRDIR